MALQIAKPNLPSSIVTWIGEEVLRAAPSFNEVVAIPIVHDWGPLGSDDEGSKLVTSFREFEAIYGNSDTPGRDAVYQAFKGQATPTGLGAGGVIVHRMATGSAAPAEVTINNTTPAAALNLEAVYSGDRGEDISYILDDDPSDGTRDRLRILFKGAEVERYSYPNTDVAQLALLINNRPSAYVRATSLISGVALTPTAGTAFAGGDDGSAIGSTQWLAALDALEFANFGIFAPFNLTDTSIKASIVQWMQQQEAEMRPVRAVFGGAAGEDVAAAIAELTANPTWRDPHLIRFGVGTYHDESLDKDLSTSQLAPRIAGVLAARGRRSALTRALVGDLTVVGSTGPTSLDLIAGRDAGVTMLRRVSHADADLAVSQGVSTFNSRTTEGRPYDLFSEPRIVGVLDQFLREMVEWGDDVVIGDLTVTDDTRNEVRKEVSKKLDALVSDGLAVPGTTSVDVEPPDDPALEDAIPYEFSFKPTRTANYLIGFGKVR